MPLEGGINKGKDTEECLIPQRAVIEGNLNAEGRVVINGRFVGGKVTVKGMVYVGPEALVTGEIEANEVIIGGRFEGNVVALERLEIESAGELTGEVQAKRLLINDGAKFEGTCRMSSDSQPHAAKTPSPAKTESPASAKESRKEKEKVAAKKLTVTIDGPAGAGKTTIARRLAKDLGYTYLDTGAMYRALTWKALEQKIDLEDAEALVDLASNTEIKLVSNSNYTQVFVDGKDVSTEIRKPHVTQGTSYIADVKGVRQIMVLRQQELGNGGAVILEGRDTGTVVFPKAQKKFYLDASLEERAQRRAKELNGKGLSVDLHQVKEEIQNRDTRDRNRPYGTLRKASEAFTIDTTKMSIDDVARVAMRYIAQG